MSKCESTTNCIDLDPQTTDLIEKEAHPILGIHIFNLYCILAFNSQHTILNF